MFSVFYTLTQPRTWGSNWSHTGDICFFKQNKLKKKSLKPESQMLRGVVYRLIEYLAYVGHSSIWKLICAISDCRCPSIKHPQHKWSWIRHCILFTHSEAQIFVYYLFFIMGQVKLSMDKYLMHFYLSLGKYKLLLFPHPCLYVFIWASTRQNLFSGFPTKRVSNQSPQLQRLARKLKFHL